MSRARPGWAEPRPPLGEITQFQRVAPALGWRRARKGIVYKFISIICDLGTRDRRVWVEPLIERSHAEGEDGTLIGLSRLDENDDLHRDAGHCGGCRGCAMAPSDRALAPACDRKVQGPVLPHPDPLGAAGSPAPRR